MKKASFVVMGLGAAVVIFAVVCFIVAGSLISDIESYTGMLMGGMPGMDGKALIDFVIDMGVDVGGFELFAYKARVWLLVGGGAIIAAGALMLILGGRSSKKAAVKNNYVPTGVFNMTCPGCGAAVPSGNAFCMKCGTPMAAAAAPAPSITSTVICTCCGASNEPGNRFCMSCGSLLADHMPAPAVEPAAAAPVNTGAEAFAGTGTISATVLNSETGTIRLDAGSSVSTGTVRIDTRAEAAAHAAPAAPVYGAGPAAPFGAERPAEKPAPAKSRLSKAGDL